MKTWNTHAWYVVAILLALLIGTISVKWNEVDRLPEIISFALGLSSLLLAVFTIVQSLTTTNDATAALGSVREAANEMRTIARDINSAAGDLRTVSGSMVESSEAGRTAINEIKDQLVQKNLAPLNQAEEGGANNQSNDDSLGRLTFGGAGALYAAIRAFQSGKTLNFNEIFVGESTTHEMGFLGGMRAAKFLDFRGKERAIHVTAIEGDIEVIIADLRSREFSLTSDDLGTLAERLQKVDAYFASRPDSTPTSSQLS